jgi:SAM-dependent methyltransferase
VGHPLDLAALRPGEAVLDLGSGSGTDVFCAAVLVGQSGRVVGVDITPEQLDKAARLRDRDGFLQVELVDAHIEQLPFEDASFDAVISNGVINLSPLKHHVFAEAARVLRPGGRLAIADIVGGRALKERTRRNVELWAACIAGAIPRGSYLDALEAQGLHAKELRKNDYRFISERALDACSTYEVESISLLASKPIGLARLTSRPDLAGDADVTRAAADERPGDTATTEGSAASTHRSNQEEMPPRLGRGDL